jgi:hypothetical protein
MKYKSHKVGNIEIMDNDLSYYDLEIRFDHYGRGQSIFSFDSVVHLCQEMGDGWKIPNFDQFRFFKQFYDLRILNFDRGSGYWISDVNSGFPTKQVAYLWDMSVGSAYKGDKFSVRLIREI